MATVYQFEFTPDAQARREPVLTAIRQATAERTLAAVQDALRVSSEWLFEHPEDYAVLDIGSDLTRLEEALLLSEPVPAPASVG